MLFLKENGLEASFLPHLLSSQPCEAIFRQIRSLSSTYSTVVNCTVKEILGRINKISLQNDIVKNLSSTSNIVIPKALALAKSQHKELVALPTAEEIRNQIEISKAAAIKDAINFGLVTFKKSQHLKLNCTIKHCATKRNKAASTNMKNISIDLKRILP